MTKMKLAVISGSLREGRYGPGIARWFTEQVAAHGQFDVDVIDPADTALPAALPISQERLLDVDDRPAEMRRLAGRLARADAFAVVTPEYNHSYPAALKHLIDWHLTPWQAKPVALISYGGQGGGIRAAEHLRQVFNELHAVTIRNWLSFDQHWTRFDTDGRLTRDAEDAQAAAKALLDQLGWWSTALRQARLAVPYQAA
ncbi:NADPH-dependent FMN reductase [Nonomuraea gerenzanensis]|uniref:NADPH-dependent FMN reductase n=1 Tax=Nonomuraea gerenzanensis TaxID=93944 RepID=A0A1M4E9P7_9ACTN|nr:NAD(P)H-dependent oxidoreductase [Nonomuraea gerenzanensis]UBU17571.1 NAD(P)H-dependent oxidoreductase [Nonomuraea gerenzanensis]SBO95333.1 NADPH-dependent FMN reductase [Nonomuraea gerenzanensis]